MRRAALLRTAGLFACAVGPCARAAAASTGPTIETAGLLQMLLSLLLVIGLIVGLSWLVGRVRTVNRSSSGSMSVLGELVIGPKERVVLVRIGEAQALLGVSSAGVNSLSLLEKPLQIAEPAAINPASFAQKLREAMNRTGMGK